MTPTSRVWIAALAIGLGSAAVVIVLLAVMLLDVNDSLDVQRDR
jgi:hypothetical protein